MVKVINNYTLIEKIGEGTYGEVYRALNTKKMGEFAVKVIPVQKFKENSLLEQCVVKEIKTLSMIEPSQYIVKYEDHFQTRNNYYFVYEYCNGGTLMDALKRDSSFSQQKSFSIFRQLLQAFKVLNRFNIMHRDVKPENIFLNNGKVKLGDFGFCKDLKPGQHMAKTMLGSPIYMAPEVLRGETYTMKADIWSLGVVLYEMLFGECPFQSNSIAMLISTINNNNLSMPLSSHPISYKAQQLLKKMLTKDYFRRISWIELFAFKIDKDGKFIQNDLTPQSPYSRSNISYSAIKGQSTGKPLEKSNQTKKSYASSISKQPKLKFYSQKYMNFVSQPLVISSNNLTQRKISLFTQTLQDNVCSKDYLNKSSQSNTSEKSLQQLLPLPKISSKRSQLLAKHHQCLYTLKSTLLALQSRKIEALQQCYGILIKVHRKLKEITEEIKVSQTDLLDVASLINYQVIQVDRQLIETKQQLLRRNIPIPKYQHQRQLKTKTMKSVQDPLTFEPNYLLLFHTQQYK